jgi:hypothetical protein
LEWDEQKGAHAKALELTIPFTFAQQISRKRENERFFNGREGSEMEV